MLRRCSIQSLILLVLMLALGFGQESVRLERTGNIREGHINESSGLALASNHGLWTINDSGNKPELYLINLDGTLELTVSLINATNVDWESMSKSEINGKKMLFVADVGDNALKRKSVSLYVLPEPDLDNIPGDGKLKMRCSRIQFTYEDGPHNCEAIAIDATNQCIYLIEKVYVDDRRKTPPGIYRIPLVTGPTKKAVVARRVGDFSVRNVTGMDISGNGRRLIIRDYLRAYLYDNPERKKWETVIGNAKPTIVPCPLQLQGEAICFSRDANSIYLTSEKAKQPIWKVAIPKSSTSPPK